jgi:hypothetical protein
MAGTVPFAELARSFERSAWLQRFFEKRSYHGSPQNFFCSRRHYKNGNYHAICLFEYLFTPYGLSHTAQTFQHMMDCMVDGLEGVFAYMDDSRVGSPVRQTPPSFGSFFQCFGRQWSHHQPKEMRFCSHHPGDSWPHDFGNRIGPHGRSCHCNQILPSPPRTSSNCSVFSAW